VGHQRFFRGKGTSVPMLATLLTPGPSQAELVSVPRNWQADVGNEKLDEAGGATTREDSPRRKGCEPIAI